MNMDSALPTYRTAVDMTEVKFQEFRRTLRPLDRKRLDMIFEFARKHGGSDTLAEEPNKTELVLICTLLELIGRIEDLESVTDKEWK